MLPMLKFNFGTLDAVALVLFALFILLTDYRPTWWLQWKKQRLEADVTAPPVSKPSVRDLPGPRAVPVLGTRWIYSVFGPYEMNKIHLAYQNMFDRFGCIFREEALWNFPVVSLLERESIEKVLRHPSKFPLRPPTEVTSHYRKSRPDRYTTLGLVNEQGENWHLLRSVLTPELTSAKTMLRFLPELNVVAEDFNSLVRSNRNEHGLVKGFEELTNRMGLESTCTLILGRRMGFLDQQVDPLAARLAAAVKVQFCASRDTFYGLPFWKAFATPAYKKMIHSEDQIYDIISDLVEGALKEEQDTCAVDAVQSVFMSVLQAPELDIRDKKAAIIDFIASGIQTLGNTLVFLLYLVAKNPSVQKRLYEEVVEIAAPGSPITASALKGATYLKACVMEAFRVLPTATCVARILETKMELSGYELSSGTVVLCHTWLACQQQANFSCPQEYRPERWLPESSLSVSSPSLVVPFGCGRRMCPGKRFIEQELQLVLAKVIREFHIEFDGELDLQFEFLLTAVGPVNFTMRDRF